MAETDRIDTEGLLQPLADHVATRPCRCGPMSFFSFDGPIGDSLAVYGEWAQPEIDFLTRLIPPGSIVVDAGANVGTHTLAFSRAVGDAGRVYAIEAQPQVFALLRRNAAGNGASNVRSVNAAVSGAPGTIAIPALDPTRRQNVGAVSLATPAPAPAGRETFTVPILTLDGLCGDDPVRLIKLDVEAMELESLHGAQGLLDRCRPLVYLECNELERGWDIVKFFRPLGYSARFCRFPAFNGANFRGNADNVFGVAEESALLFIPAERLDEVQAVIDGRPGIESLDDLATALLATPRYGDDTAYDRDPEQLRRRSAALEDAHTAAAAVEDAAARRVRDAVERALAIAHPAPVSAPLQCSAAYDILIPVYDAYDHVKRCVDSVLRHTDPRHAVVLLDDASPDERILPLLREFERADARVRVVTAERNLGFVGNMNRGFALSSRDVVILNSDTEVTPQWLERLDRCRRSDAAIGIVSPLSNNATILSVPVMGQANRLPDGTSAQDFAALVAEVSPRAYPRLPTAVGFCMLITRAALERVGAFDPAFGLGYGEESDFCMRAWQRGIETACCDDAYVHHYGEASFGSVKQIDRRRLDNARLMSKRWPRYDTAVQVFCHHNPLRQVQERLQAALDHGPAERRPHVLQVIHSFDVPGGTELHTRKLVDGLAERYRFSVMYPGKARQSKAHDYIEFHVERRAEHLRVAELRGRNVVAGESFLGVAADLDNAVVEENFTRFVAGGDYDIVHFQHLAHWDSLMLPIIAKALGKRVAVTLHDYYLLCPEYNLILPQYKRCGKTAARGDDPQCLRCLGAKRDIKGHEPPQALDRYLAERRSVVRQMLAAADVLIAPSTFVRERFRAAFGADVGARIRVIPHGVMVTKRSPRPPRGAALRVGFLGNLTDRKGAHTLLDTAERLRGSPVQIEVFGGVQDVIEERAAALGIKRHGNYTYEKLPQLLERVDVVIVPSVWDESFCMTVSEAQAMGVPLVAAAVGAITERVIDGVNGFLVPPSNPQALAQRLLDLAADRNSLKLVHEGLSRHAPKTMADNLRDYETVYGELLRGRDVSREIVRGLLHITDAEAAAAAQDQLIDTYEAWLAGRQTDAAQLDQLQRTVGARPQPAMHLIMTVSGGDLPRLPDTLDALGAQRYDRWRLTIVGDLPAPSPVFGQHPALQWIQAPRDAWLAAVNRASRNVAADWTGLIEAGDRFDADLLLRCADYIQRHPQWRLVYTDEDLASPDGRHREPRLKPDANLEWLRAQAYTGRFALINREALLGLDGYAMLEGMDSYDAALRIVERWGTAAVGHVPHLLYHRLDANRIADERLMALGIQIVTEHLARAGVQAAVRAGPVAGTWHVDYAPPALPRTAIIVHGPASGEEYAQTIASVLGKTAYPDLRVWLHAPRGGSEAVQACKTLAAQDTRVGVLETTEAIGALDADYLVFLRAGTVVVQPPWLERMVAQALQPAVGVVGARIVGLDQRITGVGKILGAGPAGIAAPLQPGLPHGAPGYLGRAQVAQDISAVDGNGMLIETALYRDIGLDLLAGGLCHRDVEICLQAGERGRRVVWTPHSTLVAPRPSRSDVVSPHEAEHMLSRWIGRLADDPTFHPALCLQRQDAALESQLPGWSTRDNHDLPRILGMGFGSEGSWQFRGAQPLAALTRQGLSQTGTVAMPRDRVRVPNATELARLGVDSLLLYNTIHDDQLQALRDYRRFNDVFITFGQDDLITALPALNPLRNTVYKDIKKRLRTALSLCDRLIVTTETLGRHFRGLVEDIRVVPNRLDPRWSQLKSERRTGARPRVGWVGALQHEGDLRLLTDVVKETAGEVDWVFMGMCPEVIRPYVTEFHGPVPFDRYPAMLASLNLDIAVAPLEHNSFNEAKSNLRLLEYGALGLPVVCTDIQPYRDAPVARVANTTRAWVTALRERIHDPDAAEREGMRLREWVLAEWMLEDHAAEWLAALRPSPRQNAKARDARTQRPSDSKRVVQSNSAAAAVE